jgi:hypothetical protein
MATTYWAVRHDMGYHSTEDPNTRRKAPPRVDEETARGWQRRDGGKLVKVTRFDKAETRTRSEARGAARALSAALAALTEQGAFAGNLRMREMLEDARERAGAQAKETE